MAPGNEELGELDHSSKDHKNEHDPDRLTVVGEAEGEPGNRENGEMLNGVSHARYRPQRGGTSDSAVMPISRTQPAIRATFRTETLTITPMRHVLIARRGSRLEHASAVGGFSAQQPGFLETVREPPRILFPFERQPAQMFTERIFRVDLFEFAPNATGLVDLAEMTESGRERGT